MAAAIRSPNNSPVLYQEGTYAPGILDGSFGSLTLSQDGSWSYTLAGANALAARLAQSSALQALMTKRPALRLLIEQTVDRFGRLDVLVNNAGVGAGSTVWESTLADWQWVMGVNLWGVMTASQQAARRLGQGGGDGRRPGVRAGESDLPAFDPRSA